jgi:hypothetical protein
MRGFHWTTSMLTWSAMMCSMRPSGPSRVEHSPLNTQQAIGSFAARSFLTPQEYQTEVEDNKASGRHLRYMNSYLHEGKLHFSAIWAEKPEVSSLKVDDGFYVTLRPLDVGQHTIHFTAARGGPLDPDPLELDVTYNLTVVPVTLR